MNISPRTRWIGMIVGLLSLSVGVNLYVLFKFAGSPSETLEENWEQRSENWNAIQLQNTINRQLGWKASIQGWDTSQEPARVRLQLQDAEDKPLLDADVSYYMFHRAHPDVVYRGKAPMSTMGTYDWDIPSPKEGYWEIRIELTHAGQAFTQTWQEYFQPPTAGPTQ
ncbi:MAG: FixH family protein [Planctomycetes bacterium]|nr:FixH family protein [Planctomycetota bacterium]MCB9910748.1 FixH family protein [Planctomycetota bacterium]MCB9912774.1 FixH family protein [Planctomycetota bacterium]HPF14774.1 FixH family protein [Planctomycetota bacterium]HRV82538.1 FixH family protein [Planctomycetota bacterium]